MTLVVDVSNWTSPITPAELEQWKQRGVGLVIVQAWAGPVRTQLQLCQDAGIPTDAYVFVYPGDTAALIRSRLALCDGYTIRRLWLDVELQGVSPQLVRMALGECDKYPTRLNPTGIYTGRWYWQPATGAMKNTTAFANRPLWDSNYDGVYDTTVDFKPYGGWTSATIKQYQDTSTLDGVGNVDLDVLSASDAATLIPEEPQLPVSIIVGQGMADAMRAHSDQPLFGHLNWTEVDDSGVTFQVEACYGSLGRYVSSNASGQWVNAGPLA